MEMPTRLVAMLCGLMGGLCLAAPPAAERTVAGLDAAVHASWTSLPLAEWTTRATALAGRPVILDRRIDPTRPVTLTARGETLREVLDRVAADAGAAVEELESTIRIVPKHVAGQAARAEAERRLQVAKLPAARQRVLAAAGGWRWPAATRPRDLVADLAATAGLAIEGVDAIPHDHFPAADLPPLALAERLDLVLAHFDRRIAWNGGAARIVPIDAGISPAALAAADRPAPRPSGPARRTVAVRDEFTLRLEAPLDQALAAIARQLDLDVDLDVASLAARGIAPGEIVRADVTKASRETLFDAILQPVGLAWRIEGRTLRVFAPGRAPE